jgi:hypothetical protein
MSPGLTVPAFVARWHGSVLSELSATPSNFIDRCEVLSELRCPVGMRRQVYV